MIFDQLFHIPYVCHIQQENSLANRLALASDAGGGAKWRLERA
jgi:hypothetical protein